MHALSKNGYTPGPHFPKLLFWCLACLYIGNLVFDLEGFFITKEPWGTVKDVFGYLLPAAIWLTFRKTPETRRKRLKSRFLFVFAILNFFALLAASCFGPLNPGFRKTGMNFEPNDFYWSDDAECRTILQKVRHRNVTIILESVAWDDLDRTHFYELSYFETLNSFLRRKRRVCEIQSCKEANFVIDEKREVLSIGATSKSGDNRKLKHEFSLDFEKAKLEFLKL